MSGLLAALSASILEGPSGDMCDLLETASGGGDRFLVRSLPRMRNITLLGPNVVQDAGVIMDVFELADAARAPISLPYSGWLGSVRISSLIDSLPLSQIR